MNKRIWIAAGAALVLIVFVLLCVGGGEGERPAAPSLPALETGHSATEGPAQPGGTDGMAADRTEPGTAGTRSQTDTRPDAAEPTEMWIDPAPQPEPEPDPAQGTARPAEPAHGGDTSGQTAPQDPDPSGGDGTEASDAPAETGGSTGFPILPPDIFP